MWGEDNVDIMSSLQLTPNVLSRVLTKPITRHQTGRARLGAVCLSERLNLLLITQRGSYLKIKKHLNVTAEFNRERRGRWWWFVIKWFDHCIRVLRQPWHTLLLHPFSFWLAAIQDPRNAEMRNVRQAGSDAVTDGSVAVTAAGVRCYRHLLAVWGHGRRARRLSFGSLPFSFLFISLILYFYLSPLFLLCLSPWSCQR